MTSKSPKQLLEWLSRPEVTYFKVTNDADGNVSLRWGVNIDDGTDPGATHFLVRGPDVRKAIRLAMEREGSWRKGGEWIHPTVRMREDRLGD